MENVKNYIKEVLSGLIILLIPLILWIILGGLPFLIWTILTLIAILISPFYEKSKIIKWIMIICMIPFLLIMLIGRTTYIYFQSFMCFLAVFSFIFFLSNFILGVLAITFMNDSEITQESLKMLSIQSLPLSFTISAIVISNWGTKPVKFLYKHMVNEEKPGHNYNPFNQSLIRWVFYLIYFILLSFVFLNHNSLGIVNIESRLTSQKVIGSFALYIAFDRVAQHDFVKNFSLQKAGTQFLNYMQEWNKKESSK